MVNRFDQHILPGHLSETNLNESDGSIFS